MDAGGSDGMDGMGASGRRESMRRLVAERGIDALLVSIPKLARLLGYAPSTLYAHIKAGAFFLPLRLVNGAPAVLVEDLVDWLADGGARAPRSRRPSARAPAEAPERGRGPGGRANGILDRDEVERKAMRAPSRR